MPKTCFFSPYLSKMHAGGGEKHLLEIALVVAQKNQVFIAIAQTQTASLAEYREFYSRFLGKNLSQLKFIWAPLFTNASFWQKLWWTGKFDQLFYVTDGSLFFSLARRNFLHIQIPLAISKNSLLDRLKLINWSLINVNSKFTKDVIEKYWRVKVDRVLYPSVNTNEFKSLTGKKPIILSVGRFFTHLHSKRQDILVDCFIKLREKYPQQFANWQLVFVGKPEDQTFFDRVKAQSQGLPIKFLTEADRKKLTELFTRSSILWHAAGYGIDEKREPEKVEHLGIVTLEAMAAGCVPVVVGKGGQKEILGEKLAELMWQTQEECLVITHQLVANQAVYRQLQKQVKARAQDFNQEKFTQAVKELFGIF